MENITFGLAVGASATSSTWTNTTTTWSDFVKKMSKPRHTAETLDQFLKMSKEDQGKIKDVGGYVGGHLRGGKRNPQNVLHRQLLTLDIDFAEMGFAEMFDLTFSCEALIHGTHKHYKESPRFRLLIPLDRPVSPIEYEAIARKVAEFMDIEAFDPTTFQVNRLMFWQSSPSDVEYYVEHLKGDIMCADEMLAQYVDYTDTTTWAFSASATKAYSALAEKQEDPLNKNGIIGAFCRSYSIHEAIEELLGDVYEPCTQPERYTYKLGSAAGGLVTYEDKFAYSHHGTDPISGLMCNAFDLVRIHKFGLLDNDKNTKASFSAMVDFINSDDRVSKEIYETKQRLASAMFSDFIDYAEVKTLADSEESDDSWVTKLQSDKNGNYLSTAGNINLIFRNDKVLKRAFKTNLFDNKRYIAKSVPWRKVQSVEPIKSVDAAGVRNYIEYIYGISNVQKIKDAMALEMQRNSFHPVREYLDSLPSWDGVKRIDSLLVDYFGVEDNAYTREAIRKHLVAAVARIYNAGCKYELVLTLVGGQGIGKSTFLRKLGKSWFSDNFSTVDGNKAYEQLIGFWHLEMAELAGLKRAEVEAVKHYISVQSDTLRLAYAEETETFHRQCVFGATTNVMSFLKDATGSRRFNPIAVGEGTKSVFDSSLEDSVDLLYAEAIHLYNNGETLYLSPEANAIANAVRGQHTEEDERLGVIEEFIDAPISTDWDNMTTAERVVFLGDKSSKAETVERTRVCILEIWCECLGKNRSELSKYASKELSDIMRKLPEWEYVASGVKFGTYGKQRYYQRKVAREAGH